jgi:hypothetical protein
MPYNLAMNELTLVLPFALPPPELAPDLIRALKAPSLAALLSRNSARQFIPFDNGTRVLPHEAWLSHALGLGPAPQEAGAGAPFAVAAMRGYGLAPADGHWFLVHPVHVQIAGSHLVMGDLRLLTISEADGRALFAAAKPYFDDTGKTLVYGDAGTWFVRADDWAGLRTASPDAAAGQNLMAWMPEGERAAACRKLQNEIQMLWHEHPINEAREARGLQALNAFWLWGGAAGQAGDAASVSAGPTQVSAEPAPLIADGPPWLAALAEPARRGALDTVIERIDGGLLLCLDSLSAPGLAEDWSAWLSQMRQLEDEWFAPLLSALRQGRLDRLTLVLDHRDAWAVISSGKYAQRKFWRTPTLNSLIP